ncbi:phosphoadenosine phosphosulfate reductase family protein [Micromonospora sp. C51]|uniref:phosphoadenosine phosphosulfate reductase domain-containing protein n=1 Tax=Micromonospora sp. C51 TaxID=2824879 RepID=UPI001B38165A|nr:phosphoadenosine phosphosulfate reductase family protein [Micromonospora sp. C51]MBQ1048479.1 phosphoadenosine phosphosulfate reductase family protein [Micromonospora sp. C51]
MNAKRLPLAVVRRTPPAPVVPVVDLTAWDFIVVWSSGGKDSQTALAETVRQALAASIPLSRIIVAHNDMGDAEWLGTLDLARRQAGRHGLRFIVVRRRDGMSLLDDIRRRRKFPDAARRWCTSDHKRGPGRTLLTLLVDELGGRKALGRPARVLQVYGFRAAESSGRAAKHPFTRNDGASTKTTRDVWDWYPIHHWSDAQVWADIRATGAPYHWAYVRGMSRLSCSFCVLASRADLVTAARLLPVKAAAYAQVEAEIGHSFQVGGSKKKPTPKPIAGVIAGAGRAIEDAPCPACAAELHGADPAVVHEVPADVAQAMFGRGGLVCNGRFYLDPATWQPASPFVDDELAHVVAAASDEEHADAWEQLLALAVTR